jgi:hypothetical protein
MLQQDFTPPPLELAQKETDKRLKALNKFFPRIQRGITSLSITGSMASGQNYAVTEKSDLDMQITIIPESVKLLAATNLFPNQVLDQTFDAYLSGLIGQFSFSLEIDGIGHECHFWDQQALIDAMEMRSGSTKRIRTTNTTPAIDYGFSFDGSQDAYECPTHQENDLFISILPSFRIVKGKLFLSRPVTNWLATPYVLFGEDLLRPHINLCWETVITKLVQQTHQPVDLKTFNILNALPSKFKASPKAKQAILTRTKIELDKVGIIYQE